MFFHLFEARMSISLWGQDVSGEGKQPVISVMTQKGTELAGLDCKVPLALATNQDKASPERFPPAKWKHSLCSSSVTDTRQG